MNVECPLPPALTDIPDSVCPFRIDQVVRLAFMRRAALAFATEAAMKLLATWTPLLSAAGDTKIVMSPIFSGFVIPQSEAIVVGGNDNTTFAGIREYYGEGSVTATGTFKNLQPATKEALELLSQESLANGVGVSNLVAIPINRYGFMFHKALKGFPIYNFRIGSRGTEGLNAPDINAFSFDLMPNWDQGLSSLKPEFDPLTELIPA